MFSEIYNKIKVICFKAISFNINYNLKKERGKSMKSKLIAIIFCTLSGLILTSCGTSTEDRYSEGFEAGESEGYSDGYTNGFEDGSSEGYGDGYADGSSEGYGDGYADGFEDGTSEGYGDGYADGYEEGSGNDGGYNDGYYDNELVFNIHTEEQNAYLHGTSFDLNSKIDGLEERSKPLTLTLTAQNDSRYKSSEVNRYLLKLASTKELSDAKIYENPISGTFTLKNLNIGTRYFYQIDAVTNNGTYSSVVKSFSVADDAPRNLDIDGVTNARDVGGWTIEGTNNKTKQNLLYRTGKLHDDFLTCVTEQGKKDILDLGIKTEIDLRTDVSSTSSLVEGLDYYNCGMDGLDYFNHPTDRNGLKKAFDVLSDVNNYPILYHCAIGTDRTGFLTYLIDCLAGVSVEDMKRDYVFSCFGSIGGVRYSNTIDGYINKFNDVYHANNDLEVGATNFLKDIGVTEGKIKIVQNMITKGFDDSTHNPSSEWAISTSAPNQYHEKVCTDAKCGAVIHKEKHNYSPMEVRTEATVNKDGEAYHYCLTCGYEETFVLPKTGGEVNYVGMDTYGSSATFTMKLDSTLTHINSSQTDVALYVGDTKLSGVTYQYEKLSSNNFATIKFNLAKSLNAGDVVTVKEGTIFSDGVTHLVLSKDVYLTYNGVAFYPSFLTSDIPAIRKGEDGTHIEIPSDFSECKDGQASDGLQPYYTYKNGRGSNFKYTIQRNGQVFRTYENDCIGSNHNDEVITAMHWAKANILRITFASISHFVDGDIFVVHKGSTYCDNGGHAGHKDDVKKFILHKDLYLRFDAENSTFVPTNI